MDPIIRAAVVSSVPRQLRGATPRVTSAHRAPVAAHIAQKVLTTAPPAVSASVVVPTSEPVAVPAAEPVSSAERAAYDAAVRNVEQQQAQLLVDRKKLEDEAESLLADAQQRGMKQGLEQGERQAHSQVAGLVALLVTALDAVKAAHSSALAQAEDMLVEVAYAAVCRIIGTAATNRAVLLEMVRGVAQDEYATQPLCLRLHPQDLAMLQQDANIIDARITLQFDSSVVLGGCLIDSDRGTLDARLETQLARLAEALVARRSGATL